MFVNIRKNITVGDIYTTENNPKLPDHKVWVTTQQILRL
jgi:hypothetical protein